MTLFPHLQSRRVRLQPASSQDSIKLYELLLKLGLNTLPSPDEFVSVFGRNVVAPFLVESLRHDEVVGFCSLHSLSEAGHVEGGTYMSPDKSANGVGAEASMLMINYAFAMWNLRKVYFHTTQASLAAIGGDIKLSQKEGILSAFQYFSGKHWDVHVFAIYRDEWDQYCAPTVERLVRGRRSMSVFGRHGQHGRRSV